MSVRQDDKGRWYFRKWAKAPGGVRKRLCGYPTINTKRAAEHAERQAVLRFENPEQAARMAQVAPDVPTVREYHETFLTGYAGAHKPSELVGKRRILAAHILPTFGEHQLGTILQADVDAFVADLLARNEAGGQRSRKTVNNITAVLSSLLRYAAKNRLCPPIDLDFAIDADEPAEIVPVSQADAAKLLAVAGPRYRVAILLALDAGLRIGEVRGLQWGDINELKRTVTVSRAIDIRNNVGPTKNRRRRTVDMTTRLRAALKKAPRRGRWVIAKRDGTALGYYAMREHILALYEKARVAPPPKPWHCLRHSFCTNLAAAGVPIQDIQRLAGHADIKTTLRYMNSSEASRKAAIAALERQNGQ